MKQNEYKQKNQKTDVISIPYLALFMDLVTTTTKKHCLSHHHPDTGLSSMNGSDCISVNDLGYLFLCNASK